MTLPCGKEKPISDCVNYCNIQVDECISDKEQVVICVEFVNKEDNYEERVIMGVFSTWGKAIKYVTEFDEKDYDLLYWHLTEETIDRVGVMPCRWMKYGKYGKLLQTNIL